MLRGLSKTRMACASAATLRSRQPVYSFDWTGDFRAWLANVRRRQTWRRVAPNVWFIGLTSLLTDISSEMVASILPLYLVLGL